MPLRRKFGGGREAAMGLTGASLPEQEVEESRRSKDLPARPQPSGCH